MLHDHSDEGGDSALNMNTGCPGVRRPGRRYAGTAKRPQSVMSAGMRRTLWALPLGAVAAILFAWQWIYTAPETNDARSPAPFRADESVRAPPAGGRRPLAARPDDRRDDFAASLDVRALRQLCGRPWEAAFSRECSAALERRYRATVPELDPGGFRPVMLGEPITWAQVFDDTDSALAAVTQALAQPECLVPEGALRALGPFPPAFGLRQFGNEQAALMEAAARLGSDWALSSVLWWPHDLFAVAEDQFDAVARERPVLAELLRMRRADGVQRIKHAVVAFRLGEALGVEVHPEGVLAFTGEVGLDEHRAAWRLAAPRLMELGWTLVVADPEGGAARRFETPADLWGDENWIEWVLERRVTLVPGLPAPPR